VANEAAIGKTFVELADTLVEGYDLIEFLHLLAERCVLVLGVAEAGVVLSDAGGGLWTLASSSERMRDLELMELQRRDGPCLDCCRVGKPIHEHDLATARGRWPHFTPAALEAGFRSVYALPLRLRTERLGALNLFAERGAGMSQDDQALAQAMADVATIGILHARVLHEREALSEQLQIALNSRVLLEQAKGVVAEQAGIDMGEAFQLLRRYARNNNRPITGVVQAIIDREMSADELRASPGRRSTSS